MMGWETCETRERGTWTRDRETGSRDIVFCMGRVGRNQKTSLPASYLCPCPISVLASGDQLIRASYLHAPLLDNAFSNCGFTAHWQGKASIRSTSSGAQANSR
jgi:hypothetical protein